MPDPLILALHLDAPTQLVYEQLRRRHFPPERNQIPAHLTLFHQLPDEPPTHQAVHEIVATTPPFHLTQPSPRSIGRGVAVFFHSPELASLYAKLATEFQPHLIPQDRQPFRPHIVVQNKVAPEAARATLAQLDTAALPKPYALGLTLWRYLGGPWEHLEDFPFSPGLSR